MGLRKHLAGLAGKAPARVFVVTGRGARKPVERLRLDPRLEFVDSPRSATILLVAGELPDLLRAAARALHDSLPRPRATVWWAPESGSPELADFPGALVLSAGDDVGAELMLTQAALLRGEQSSEPGLLPDTDPAPWRGVGPYGQGGTGMTGGVPYGRPLAGRAPDRDGLELDQLPVHVGPFFPAFPPGLILDVKLQGDVIQAAAVGANAFARTGARRGAAASVRGPFVRALAQPVSIAELELARARHHLMWLGHALRIHGLGALGRRAWRLAGVLSPARAGEVQALRRLLDGTRSLGWATSGVGVTDPTLLEKMSPGPVARAAGIARDARAEDPAYVALGFEPVVQRGGDARARWRQRVDEVLQALCLARQADGGSSTPVGRIESPRGTLTTANSPAAELLELVPALLTGMEWGDAVTTIVSLDLDLEEAASPRAAAT
ncbi:MAG: hypothetical protein ABI766_04815 [Gemmatimonadales bacterium]